MDNVTLYSKNNTLQQHDAIECLEVYLKKIQWKKDPMVIDIGCGDGIVTVNILKESLPSLKKLVGCDMNEEMVKFANANYGSHDTSFIKLDIEKNIPENMRGMFQYAFSFYVLMWPRRHDLVYKNIYDLLDEGGECVLMFLGQSSIYTAYRNLAQSPRWSPWLKDVEQYICHFHDSQDPVKEIKQIMDNIGFSKVDVEYKPRSYLYADVDAKITGFKAVSPFKVPEELFQEFMEDIIIEMHRIDRINRKEKYSVAISTFYYNLIYVHAKK